MENFYLSTALLKMAGGVGGSISHISPRILPVSTSIHLMNSYNFKNSKLNGFVYFNWIRVFQM